MLESVIIAGLALLIVSAGWYVWVARLLTPQDAVLGAPEPVPAVERVAPPVAPAFPPAMSPPPPASAPRPPGPPPAVGAAPPPGPPPFAQLDAAPAMGAAPSPGPFGAPPAMGAAPSPGPPPPPAPVQAAPPVGSMPGPPPPPIALPAPAAPPPSVRSLEPPPVAAPAPPPWEPFAAAPPPWAPPPPPAAAVPPHDTGALGPLPPRPGSADYAPPPLILPAPADYAPPAPVPPAEPEEYLPPPTQVLGPPPPLPWTQLGLALPVVPIDRELRVAYTRHVYANQACHVNVRIGPAQRGLAPLTPGEQRVLRETRGERLQFEAEEDAPLVQVEVLFAEGTFYASRTKARQRLRPDAETRFSFVLRPLRAEDAVLTIAITYVHPVDAGEQIAERVVIDRRIRTGPDQETFEHEERLTLLPARTTLEETVVHTLELVINVKSLFRLNAAELRLGQRGLGVGLTALLVLAGLQTNPAENWPYTILALAPLLGIPVGDAASKLLERGDKSA